MAEIPAAHRSRRIHGAAFRQTDTGVRFRIEQFPDCSLFCVLRTGRITRGWPDSNVFFLNKCVVVERLARCVSPKILPDYLVQPLGKCLRKTIGQCLEHDCGVIIVRLLKFPDTLLYTDTSCYGERTQVIARRRYKVGKTHIRQTSGFLVLLPEVVQSFQRL